MDREGGLGLGGCLKVLLSLAVLCVGVLAILTSLGIFVGPDTAPDAPEAPAVEPAPEQEVVVPTPPAFAGHTWAELSTISDEIAAAGGGEASVAVAASYGLVNEDGSLIGEVCPITLTDGTQVGLVIAGICHDTLTGGGTAGLTLVSDAAIALRPMNANGDNAGGWEGSDLRSWLASDGMALLPEDLRQVVRPVDKHTNNVGSASDASQVTVTSDTLWVPSATEVCGTIDWFATEYSPAYSYWDDVANAEGTQYQLFRDGGVHSHGDPSGILVRTWQGSAVPWWYRSAFFFVYENLEGRYFYCAMDSGYPYSYAQPEMGQGVVVGLCI